MSAGRVLIVDDHGTFRSFARMVLSSAGYEVVGEAPDAAQAREAIARLDPEIVLLDVQLPDEDGLALAARYRGRADTPKLILISSRRPDELGSRLRASGLPFIAKEQLSAPALEAALAGALP